MLALGGPVVSPLEYQSAVVPKGRGAPQSGPFHCAKKRLPLGRAMENIPVCIDGGICVKTRILFSQLS